MKLENSLKNVRTLEGEHNIERIPLYGVCNFLDDNEMVRMAAKAIEPFVDDLFFLRRRVETFPNKKGKYDGIKTVPTEIELRNSLTDRVPYNSYILCFDDDEIFFGNWDMARYALSLKRPDIGTVRNIELGLRVIRRARVLYHTPTSLISDDVFAKSYAGGWIDNTNRYHRKSIINLPLFFLHLSQIRPTDYLTDRFTDYENRPEMYAMPPSKRYEKHRKPVWMDYPFTYEQKIKEAIREGYE